MKKIKHISDTHGYHELLTIEDDIDIIIHSGDFTNSKDFYSNEPEAYNFLHWYSKLKPKTKILVAGNHDAYPAIYNRAFRELCLDFGIIYLENESINIDGLKIWGSPITPTFNDWYFMRNRGKMDVLYSSIPEDTDIVITHGPPKGILDLSYNHNHQLEFCGCKSLRNHLLNRVKPKLSLFGHIHNNNDVLNQGFMKINGCDTIFSNGSVVRDRSFGTLSSNGNTFKL